MAGVARPGWPASPSQRELGDHARGLRNNGVAHLPPGRISLKVGSTRKGGHQLASVLLGEAATEHYPAADRADWGVDASGAECQVSGENLASLPGTQLRNKGPMPEAIALQSFHGTPMPNSNPSSSLSVTFKTSVRAAGKSAATMAGATLECKIVNGENDVVPD